MTTFDDWETSARWEMGERGIGYHEATPLIEEAREHHAASGQDPWAALGPPAEFAADVAAARPADQARRDTHGREPRDYLGDAVFGLGVIGVQIAVVGAIVAGGLTIPVTVAGLTGVVTASAAALVGWAGPGALRAAGHPRLAPWAFVVSAILIMLAGFAFVTLPKERIGEVPALLLLAASVAVCWLTTRPGRPRAPRRGDAVDGPEDAEAWFTRLRALLVGRFDIAPARAGELVAQARAHVAATGSRPCDEFPSLAGYAHDLAQSEPDRPGPWWRGDTARLLVTAGVGIVFAVQTVEAAVNGVWWVTVCGVLALIAIGFELRDRLRAKPLRAARPR
ncbi:hypothetical protein GCM10010112_48440 [Actinoplanes lobatus]|uniref:Putative membrane protein n=1 Tax=Actinoplanes lobatus TaxID=113568 RepID=A0A7W7HFW4_9ACTN|nr:hypothetical protein [Actinoplanes lobatus]MBB4749800.1 putative membrane protein [Actinoplanes lobatus]GGN76339.1 hypothetical protein GCM10010112_48440 [Actinoplanes lobatus]GIE38535.1 hypothetical protein Alo02nite_14330 [Actinoplanes lobatus]